MAPHDTDTPREARRHAVLLIGMAVAVALVLIGFLWWIGSAMQGPAETDAIENNPAPAETGRIAPAN